MASIIGDSDKSDLQITAYQYTPYAFIYCQYAYYSMQVHARVHANVACNALCYYYSQIVPYLVQWGESSPAKPWPCVHCESV